MYEITFSNKADKQLFKSEKRIRKRIIATLERIRPESYITKLIGDPGYKLRVGDYRIILDIDNNNLLILVIKVGHRRDIY